MFSGLFSNKCGMTFIASSFVSLFMLGGLSPVSAGENNHQQGTKHEREKYTMDQKLACCPTDRLPPAPLPTIIEEPANQTNDTLGSSAPLPMMIEELGNQTNGTLG